MVIYIYVHYSRDEELYLPLWSSNVGLIIIYIYIYIHMCVPEELIPVPEYVSSLKI